MHTNTNEQLKKSMKKAVLAALISFLLLTIFYVIMLRHELTGDQERYGYIARNQAEHITMTVDCVMSRTNTLKTMVKENQGDTSCIAWKNCPSPSDMRPTESILT